MQYKGIELEGLDKKVELAHSRFYGTDEGADWLAKLLDADKTALSHSQFHEVSALNSVINMDYQVGNGGLGQYFFNGYDQYRAPKHEQDVAQLNKDEQCDMLVELASLARDVFPTVLPHVRNSSQCRRTCARQMVTRRSTPSSMSFTGVR